MKFNSFKSLLLFLSVVLLSSCLSTTDTTVVSADGSFSSLTFAADDSVSGISSTAFTLVEYNAAIRDSMIVNLDSMVYKADINDVIATFVFKSSAAIYLKPETSKDSVAISATDTIDFTKSWRVVNYPSDGLVSHRKSYKVQVNVHQVQPKLYVWNNISSDIDSHNATSQKAIIADDVIYYYLNNGTDVYGYSSTDGKSWSALTVTGLPVKTALNDMQFFNGKLFVTKDGDKIYSSTDKLNWAVKTNPDYNFKSLLYVLDNKLWAIVQSKSTTDLLFRFASSVNGEDWIIRGEIPANFPVTDFASLAFASKTGKPKVIVSGGYSSANKAIRNSWSSEDGVYWVDFSEQNKSLDTLAVGASIITYDKKLFVFGLRTDSAKIHFKQSIDDGLSWKKPDTTYNHLPKDFALRTYQSVVVLNPRAYDKTDSKAVIEGSNRIFIIGGKKATTNETLSDVWTGKLNSKNFLLQ